MSTNAIGIVSMYYARPFTAEHFPILARIKGIGAEFVELLVPEQGDLDLAATRAAIRSNGLDVVLAARVNPTRDLGSLDDDAYRAGIAYLKYCVDVAVALGAGIVGGPIYGAPMVFAGRAPAPISDETRQRQLDRVVHGLAAASQYANDHGVKLAIEPLNRFETDFANTAHDGLVLVNAVNSPALGLVLDTFHMNMEENDMVHAIESVGDRLMLFQANENNRQIFGNGHIDWAPIARALARIKYDGPVTTEPFLRDYLGSLKTPRAQWHPPQSQDVDREDAILRASVAKLRDTLRVGRAS